MHGRSDRAENSLITTNCINNILNKGDDESKSYIREFLELYSNSDNKLDDISNLEIRNAIDNNSQTQEQFIDFNRGIKDKSICNPKKNNRKPEFSSSSRAKSVNFNIANQNEKNNFRMLDNSRDQDEPVEILSNKKTNTNATSSSSAYLNRRHVETLQKLERIKKEKEIREQSEAKFKPEINKKSREIAERISNKHSMEMNKSVKNGKKVLSKSIECIINANESNFKVYFILSKAISEKIFS